MSQKQAEYTLKVRVWGESVPDDGDWHCAEFERIAAMIAEGYSSGEVIQDGTAGGWWELEYSET